MVLSVYGTPVGILAIVVGVFASMGGFIFGFDTGQISGILLMDDFKRRFAQCTTPGDATSCKFGVYQEGTIVGLLSIGTLVGAILGSPLADRLGRRRAMSAECLIFCVGIVIQVAASTSWQQFAVGRLIAGLGVGALSIAVPVYQSETVPKQLRGSLVATYQLAITMGILLAALINLGTHTLDNSGSWRITVALSMLFAIILGVGIFAMPESPRWLAFHGRDEEAIHSIARVRGVSSTKDGGKLDSFVENDWREIRIARDIAVAAPKATWADCFRARNKTRYRTLLVMMLQSLQQLTGANYFFYYGAQIFQSVGVSDGFISQVILNAVNVLCTFLGIYVLQRYGRRWPLIIGGLWQSAWLFVFASAGTAKDPAENRAIGLLLIISACFFILGYAASWAPCIWILCGESYGPLTRSKQASLAVASNWFFNFLLAFFTQPITASIGYSYGFIFAGCNLFGAVFVYLFLYESSALSLESVDAMYNDPDCKPWTSGSWTPPGYKHRNDAGASEDKTSDAATLVEHSSGHGAKEGGKHESAI